jgi:hypothetical protein
MAESDPRLHAEDLGVVDGVLEGAGTFPSTRRTLLRRATVAAASVGALGAIDPIGSALARTLRHPDSIRTIGVTAVTAEALAVTYLTELIHKVGGQAPHKVAEILKAADAAEEDHYRFLRGAGFTPLTLKFWIPNYFFGPGLKNIAGVIEAAETLFVNAYLIGITTFAYHGKPDLARYAGEILGVEAEHRVLARDLQGDSPPNNLGFEGFRYDHEKQIVGELEKLGVGFGQKGSKPGKFYTYHGTGHLGVHLQNNSPDSTTTVFASRRTSARFTG